jgi:hypothetical protein
MWEQFEHQFRQWGRRPAETRADEGARRVVANLAARRGPDGQEGKLAQQGLLPARLSWRTLATASAVSLLVGALVWLQPGADRTSGSGAVSRGEEVVPGDIVGIPLQDENVVLWWLDARTPVYFVMQQDGGIR